MPNGTPDDDGLPSGMVESSTNKHYIRGESHPPDAEQSVTRDCHEETIPKIENKHGVAAHVPHLRVVSARGVIRVRMARTT